mmetsp:Transcript_69987/g.226377  ORF Transcript_69987/g.226377 Transcript_69987/m.226377 type:complete len:200 (-) Transcript_69987:846-1445(-)
MLPQLRAAPRINLPVQRRVDALLLPPPHVLSIGELRAIQHVTLLKPRKGAHPTNLAVRIVEETPPPPGYSPGPLDSGSSVMNCNESATSPNRAGPGSLKMPKDIARGAADLVEVGGHRSPLSSRDKSAPKALYPDHRNAPRGSGCDASATGSRWHRLHPNAAGALWLCKCPVAVCYMHFIGPEASTLVQPCPAVNARLG